MRNTLKAFEHIFVQDQNSIKLLKKHHFYNVSISGDTRFDRVSKILNRNNNLPFMDIFKGNQICFVAGSTWPEDEAIIVDYINATSKKLKYVIAPHNIKEKHIRTLKASISKKVLLYSELKGKDIFSYDVLLIDTIGILTKIYSYANIAYVGGGFKTGLHNTLEPAVFGIPIIIGPNYHGFKEAEDLVLKQAVIAIDNKTNFYKVLDGFIANDKKRTETGKINSNYISKNKGATNKIMTYIKNTL